jgi:hypothetical protein
MMIGVATVMYTTSYLARDCTFPLGSSCRMARLSRHAARIVALLCFEDCFLNRCVAVAFSPFSLLLLLRSLWLADKSIQHKHVVEKEALHEYYEKHGGAPDHH